MATKTVEAKESYVRKFVRETIWANGQVDAMEEFEEHGKVQINVRLHAFNAFLLEHLAEHLRLSRSELAVELLTKAIADAWEEAGLPEPFASDELKQKAQAYIEAHTK